MSALQRRINRITGVAGAGARRRESRRVQALARANASATA